MQAAAMLIKTIADAIRPPRKITVSQWAEEYRVLDESSAEPGSWRNSRTPYAVWAMDLLTPGSRCQKLILLWSSQLGKSNVGINWIGYTIACAPEIFLYLLPSGVSFHKLVNGPIKALEELPCIAEKMKTGPDATRNMTQRDFLGGKGYYATAGSAPSVAQISACLLILDELDRMGTIKGEGDPVDLARNRQTSYGDRAKTLIPCTPTDENSRVYGEYAQSDQYMYWCPCPHCGGYLVLDFFALKYPKDAPIREENCVLPCPHCGYEIHNHDKETMLDLERCHWRPHIDDEQKRRAALEAISKETGEIFEPNWTPSFDTTFHPEWIRRATPTGGVIIGLGPLPATYAPHKWVSFSDLAREYESVNASADPEKMRVFYNTRLSLRWTGMPGEEVSKEGLDALCEVYERPVPDGVGVIVATIDTQDNRLECAIIGLGEHLEMWHIDFAIFYGDPSDKDDNCYADLKSFLRSSYDGLKIRLALWDSGGHNRNPVVATVEAWQREGIPVIAIRGSNQNDASIWPLREPKRAKPKDRSYPVTIGVHACHDQLWYRLHLKPTDPGRLHFPAPWRDKDDVLHYPAGWADKIERDEYFKQLTAEKRVAKKSGYTFEKVAAHRRNEVWDLWSYAIAALYYLVNIRKVDLAAEREKRLKAREIIVQTPAPKFRKDDFLPPLDGWLNP